MNPTPTIRTYGPVRHPLRRSVLEVLALVVALVVFPSTAPIVVEWALSSHALAAMGVAGFVVGMAVWWCLPVLAEQLDRDEVER